MQFLLESFRALWSSLRIFYLLVPIQIFVSFFSEKEQQIHSTPCCSYWILTPRHNFLFILNSCWMKRLSLFGGSYPLRSSKFILESVTTSIWTTNIKHICFFSCLFTFYSNVSKICWKKKCYKNHVPMNKITLLGC